MKTRMVIFLFKFQELLQELATCSPPLRGKWTTMHHNYDKLWKIILNQNPIDDNSYPGAFVDYNNTPRRKNRSTVVIGAILNKFEKYLSKQIKRTKDVYHKTSYSFLLGMNGGNLVILNRMRNFNMDI